MTFAFDPYSRAVDIDPYPLYRRLRDDFPCYWSDGGQCWVLSRYQDIVNAAVDWETFSSAQGNMLDDRDIPERTGVTAMQELHHRVPDYGLADPDGLEWISSVTFRSPVALELEFTRH